MQQIPPDILWKIINLLSAFIGAMSGLGVTVFVFFHRSLLRRLDSIDADLKPMRTEISLNQQRLDEHEKRITRIENKL